MEQPANNNELYQEVKDSVSRIIENMGFSSVEVLAHSKLTDILVTKMLSMFSRLQMLMENSGRDPSLANEVDMFHLFRMEKVNVREIIDYMNQVLPFPPPPKDEKEDDESTAGEQKPEEGEIVKVPEINAPPSPKRDYLKLNFEVKKDKFSIPRFDDMDEYELGISVKRPIFSTTNSFIQFRNQSDDNRSHDVASSSSSRTDSISGSSKTKNSTLSRIEQEFNTNYYVPVGRPPKPSKSTPEIRPNYAGNKATQLPRLSNVPLISQRSRMSLLQKRLYQKNHERRLREEAIEFEQQQRAQAASRRYSDEFMETQIQPRINAARGKKKLTKKTGLSINVHPNSRSKENELKFGPLLKMNLTYSRFDGGVVIKKAVTTRYRLISGSWKPMRRSARIRGEVVSYEVPVVNPTRPPIPKIVIRKEADGSIVKV